MAVCVCSDVCAPILTHMSTPVFLSLSLSLSLPVPSLCSHFLCIYTCSLIISSIHSPPHTPPTHTYATSSPDIDDPLQCYNSKPSGEVVETEVEVQAPDVGFVPPDDALVIPEPATSEASYNQQSRSGSPVQDVSVKNIIYTSTHLFSLIPRHITSISMLFYMQYWKS